MYQEIQIEYQPAFVPHIGKVAAVRWSSSTYYIRGLFSRGHLSKTYFFSRLGALEIDGKIRNLSVFYHNGVVGHDFVFVFDAPDCGGVMKLIVALNGACVAGNCPPLPDMEFVHPAAHALLYSLGGFSGSSADCYLSADSNAVDLNQKAIWKWTVISAPVPNAVDLNQTVR